MAKIPQFKEAIHFEWTNVLPDYVPIKSSTFNLRHCECILTLSLVSTRNFLSEYKVCALNIFSKEKITFPINVTVYILTNNNIPVEFSRTDITGPELWRCSKSRLQKYAINSLVTLGITFNCHGKDYADSDVCVDALCKDFGMLLSDEIFSDAKIKCEDMVWNVHKNLISVRSETLLQLIQNNTNEVLEIQDLKKQTVDVFIKYVYTGKMTNPTTEAAKELYAASEKYTTAYLKETCAKFLMDNLIPENACEILVLANMHSDVEFKKYVIDYISENKIPLMENIWSDFCNNYPELANEVLNHIYN